jgi:hypothetical protein
VRLYGWPVGERGIRGGGADGREHERRKKKRSRRRRRRWRPKVPRRPLRDTPVARARVEGRPTDRRND